MALNTSLIGGRKVKIHRHTMADLEAGSHGTCNARTYSDETAISTIDILNIAPNSVWSTSMVYIELTHDEEQVSVDIINSFGEKTITVYQG